MQLRHDDPLGTIDDESSVLGHQRDISEIDFLFFDVPDALDSGLRVLVPDDQPDRHLERYGVGHAALLAFLDVVL